MKAHSLPWIGVAALAVLLTVSGCGSSQPPAPEPEVATAPPPPPPPAPEPEVREEAVETVKLEVPELEPIRFDYNEYRITPEARLALEDVSLILKDHPTWTVVLEGHCDERGTDQYNLALGESRAQSAKRYLVSLGVSEDRFQTVSYGEERPADPGSDEDAWARNRRAEFRLQAPES